MSPSPGRRGQLAALAVVALLFAAPVSAADAPGAFHLSGTVLGSLASLQQDWSEWLAAHELDDAESELDALSRLIDTTDALGMEALPELSFGAAASAAESARVGDYQRAARALAAAESLDSGRPETAFARAEVLRLQGDWWGYLVETARGYSRGVRMPHQRRIWQHNLLLWLLTTLLLTGCAFVAVLMVVRGPALFGSLLVVVRRLLPVPLAIGVIIALLVWPIMLSAGVLAVVLNWAVLLWAYARRSERWVLGMLLLLLGLTPVLLDEQRRRVAVEMAPMMQAAESARQGRLVGALFSDLPRLSLVLPESVAVQQLLADQHRRLGQCDQAMELYRTVVEQEEHNAAAWVDLGSCHYLRGEFDRAIELFRRGLSVDQELAQGHFNLGLAYSELYRFAESGRALARAQRLSSSNVTRWQDETPTRGVAEVAAGLERTGEIRRELEVSWVLEDESVAWSSPWSDYKSLPLAFAALILALLAGRFLPRAHLEAQAPPSVDWGSRWSSLFRILVPGLPELESGDSLQGALALAVAAGLLLIPWIATFGYRVAWGFEPSLSLSWLVTGTGLVLFLVYRWRREAAY